MSYETPLEKQIQHDILAWYAGRDHLNNGKGHEPSKCLEEIERKYQHPHTGVFCRLLPVYLVPNPQLASMYRISEAGRSKLAALKEELDPTPKGKPNAKPAA